MSKKQALRNHFSASRFPLLFGHRGYSAKAPENTLASFRMAVEAGVPGIELDVHLCKSGELVVIHDHNLKRTTGHDGIVEDTDYHTIRSLDAGSWFSGKFAGERILTLTELFHHIGNSVYYDIEIKHRDRKPHELEERLAFEIRKAGLSENCIVSSFNPFALKEIKAIDPRIVTAIIYCNDEEVPAILRHGEGKILSGCDILKPERVKINRGTMAFHAVFGGYPVIPWTVNDRAEAERLVRAGVMGLISDDPVTISSAVGGLSGQQKLS